MTDRWTPQTEQVAVEAACRTRFGTGETARAVLAALADAGVLAAPDAPPALIPTPAPDWETWTQYGVERTTDDGSRTWIEDDNGDWGAYTDRDQLDPQPGERVMRRTWYGTPWEEDRETA